MDFSLRSDKQVDALQLAVQRVKIAEAFRFLVIAHAWRTRRKTLP